MIDLEEKQYREVKKLGQKLGIPIFEAWLELEVRDKDGKVIHRHRQRSHSWVRNAYNHLFSQLACVNVDDSTFGAGKLSIKSTAGAMAYGSYQALVAVYNASIEAIGSGYRAAAEDDDLGIIVGTGTTAESFEDYALATLIANGTGSGQLSYVASEAPAITYSDTTLVNTLIRYLNNNSGGSIGINEAGLVAVLYVQTNSPNPRTLHARDKLTSTVTVPDTGQLKVTYTISLAFAG